MGITASNNPFSCDPAIVQAVGNFLISTGTVTMDDLFLTASLGFSCKIGGVVYENTEVFSIAIAPTLPDLKRIDFLVMNTSNSFEIIEGEPFTDVVVEPLVPNDKVFVTSIHVFGESINVSNPIPGTQFVEKVEFEDSVVTDSGSFSIKLHDKSTAFILTGAVTEVLGFEMIDEFLTSDFYIGKELRIENQTGAPFPFKHNGATNLPALFPLEEDFIVNDKDVLVFKPQKFDQLGAKLISVNRTFFEIDAINGLQGILDLKADLVSGKVPASQLPSYVDDVVEVSDYASLPVTGETGKIYVTIDNNNQYRWSGSVYVIFNAGITLTQKSITSSDLTSQDVEGFRDYINALSPNLTIATNEEVTYVVTDTHQIFKIFANGVTVGLGQTALTSGQVLEQRISDIFNREKFMNWKTIKFDALGGSQSAINSFGGTLAITAGTNTTKTSTYNTVNFIDTVRRLGLVSATTAGSSVQRVISTGIPCSMKSGFYFCADIMPSDAATVANRRSLIGLGTSFVSPIGNINPSSATSCIIMANDSAETTFSIMHNDNSGTCTKVAMGANFPATTLSADLTRIEMFVFPGGTVCFYRATRINTGHIYCGMITTNLPTQNAPLSLGFWANNETTALAVDQAFTQITIATSY